MSSASSGVSSARVTTVIKPRSGWQGVDLRELWKYRELLLFLGLRDIQVRYKQTVLGAAWAIIQPVTTMVVFTIFFGNLGGMSDKLCELPAFAGIPYAVFIYSGLLPWTFCAAAISQAAQSVVGNSNLVSRVYFPRLIIPASSVGSTLVDFAISMCVMFCLMIGFGVAFPFQMLLIPIFTVTAFLTVVGVGSLLAALNVTYRDFRYVIPFMVQLWMFASPVVFPLEFVPAEWRPLYSLNPMVGVISGFRSSILGSPFHWDCIAISGAVTIAVFLAGVMYFRRVEQRFADII